MLNGVIVRTEDDRINNGPLSKLESLVQSRQAQLQENPSQTSQRTQVKNYH